MSFDQDYDRLFIVSSFFGFAKNLSERNTVKTYFGLLTLGSIPYRAMSRCALGKNSFTFFYGLEKVFYPL